MKGVISPKLRKILNAQSPSQDYFDNHGIIFITSKQKHKSFTELNMTPIIKNHMIENRNFLEEYKDYHFFYGGPLSNWASYSFVDTTTGNPYNCSEQFMMHKKALLFSDHNTANKIMNLEHPGDQKAMGRKVEGFDVGVWNLYARDIVYEGCYYKFTQNKEAYDYLMGTEGYLLVEASPTDTIWGVGLGGYDPDIQDSKNWRGTNWLGEVLTQLREDLTGKPELVLF